MMHPLSTYFTSAKTVCLLCVIGLMFFAGCKSSEPVSDYETTIPGLQEPEPDQNYERANEILPSDVDIDSLMNSMTLREKIGQLFVVPAWGTFSNEKDVRHQRLKRLVAEHNVGGIIFMRGEIYPQAVMTNELQDVASIPLWITQDMEFGAAMRVSGTTRFTPAMGVAATGNPSNAYLAGKVTAREAKALGVHQIFGPVLDVNNNPNNPVINVRSYSADPETVSEYGQSFIEGVESEGIMATAKHFPGHGDTDTDSHLSLPTISHDYDRLDSLELVPFRFTINNGLRSVMSAHIAYPNISDNVGRPSTLDESILKSILVDSLNFEGLVVTDGLEMSGITDHYSPGEAVILSLLAGADMMLISPDELTAIADVEKAVEIGRLSEERIDQSVKKMLTLKKENGLFDHQRVDIEALSSKLNTPTYQGIADKIARNSVTVLKNEGDLLPITDAKYPKVFVLSVADDQSGSTGTSLAREIQKYHTDVTHYTLDRRSGKEEKDEILEAAKDADLVIIGSFIMVRSHQPIQLPAAQRTVVREVLNLESPSALIAFGNPYVVQGLTNVDSHILAWSSNSNQVKQTVPALFGASSVQGKLTANIPGLYSIGDGLEFNHTALRFDEPEAVGVSTDSLLNIDMVMQHAIDDSVFPGGVVGVMKDGAMIWNQRYGYHDYTKTRKVQHSDVYDLASLTKVISTTTSIMKLVDEEKIKLDDPVAKYIPEFDTPDKKDITLQHLLLHTSGLPAFKTYVDKLKTRGEILNAVRNEPLEGEPGEKYVYSDLGFILLAEVVEEVSGQRIDQYVRNKLYYPMGMNSTFFNPRDVGSWISDRVPPTEIDLLYERGTVRAYAHDERAYFMGGVAGHAGLFSTTKDLAIYSQMLLNGGYYADKSYLSPETIQTFVSHQSPINFRGFGFDRKSEGFSSAGTLTGVNTFGHLGFTGTSIWIDPDENISIILLTNRTWPSREYGSRIGEIRAAISDAVMKSLISE
ncbi:MAG: glycoside hydrolase family 3 N-terminal domain-containing protein [Balneolaceae bacterium]